MNYTEKNKLLDKISVIALMAILVEVFLYAVDKAYTGISSLLLTMPTILNVIGVIFLIISIVLYVLAYKKNKVGKIVYATEFLILAFICPFLTHWYLHSTEPLRSINPRTLWIIVLIYYIIRVLYTCGKAFLQSSNIQLKKKKNK